MFKRFGSGAAGHPHEDSLLAYADADEDVTVRDREHIANCAECSARAFELRRMHRLLQQAGAHSELPPRNVARGALQRLRQRRAAIGHVNEFFGAVAALLRGFSTLLSRETPSSDGASEHRDGRTSGG